MIQGFLCCLRKASFNAKPSLIRKSAIIAMMTDYYKTALNLLIEMLKDSGYDNWVNWLAEDIRLWETEQTTEHHLRAYGGMGSFNDVVIGNNDEVGLWKGRVFSTIQTLAYSSAKGNIQTASLEENFYGNEPTEISGWRCRNCGNAIINERNVDIYLSAFFIPKFLVKYLKEDNIEAILNIEKMLNSVNVIDKRQKVKSSITANGITFSSTNEWLWTCPNCGSGEVCSYRWLINDAVSTLIEADDNLEIKKLN
jgi:predicted RNA-binding Zn-ribbon protein involved in translation (DUF1610 family)